MPKQNLWQFFLLFLLFNRIFSAKLILQTGSVNSGISWCSWMQSKIKSNDDLMFVGFFFEHSRQKRFDHGGVYKSLQKQCARYKSWWATDGIYSAFNFVIFWNISLSSIGSSQYASHSKDVINVSLTALRKSISRSSNIKSKLVFNSFFGVFVVEIDCLYANPSLETFCIIDILFAEFVWTLFRLCNRSLVTFFDFSSNNFWMSSHRLSPNRWCGKCAFSEINRSITIGDQRAFDDSFSIKSCTT